MKRIKKWKLLSWAIYNDVDVAKMVKKQMEETNEKIGQEIELEIRNIDIDRYGFKFGIYRKIK